VRLLEIKSWAVRNHGFLKTLPCFDAEESSGDVEDALVLSLNQLDEDGFEGMGGVVDVVGKWYFILIKY
jgi:hypothetical protein